MYKMALFIIILGLTGCSTVFDKHVEWEYVEPQQYPVLNAIGYAPISNQPGQTQTVKILQAIKASKLEAYRELMEQVNGQKIDGDEALANMVLTNDALKSSVQGVVRGARVVKSYPVGDDTYATELELDFQRVYDIYISTVRPKRIKAVSYY